MSKTILKNFLCVCVCIADCSANLNFLRKLLSRTEPEPVRDNNFLKKMRFGIRKNKARRRQKKKEKRRGSQQTEKRTERNEQDTPRGEHRTILRAPHTFRSNLSGKRCFWNAIWRICTKQFIVYLFGF